MNYWESRSLQKGKSFQRLFAKGALLRNLFIRALFSMRLGNEIFLSRQLFNFSKTTTISAVLDIGCGWGQNCARTGDVSFYWVDIKGFPREQALHKGYREALEYGDNLTVPYQSSFFDVVIMINLLAHIPDDVLARLLEESRRLVKPGGRILIAAECDNDGLSYSLMNRLSSSRLKTLVAGMDHKHFRTERDVDKILTESGLSIVCKETICGHFQPFILYWTFATGTSPYRQLRYVSIAADIVLSVLDALACKLTKTMTGKRFIIGYVCTFHN
jgi:2-polyprenyl-3-methyl-5-hydroxy-6-metoxy-1,4-benzoquinol methylase